MIASAGAPDNQTGAPARMPAMRARGSSSWRTSPRCSARCASTCGPASYEVVTAAAGRPGPRPGRPAPPDAVILDLGLPDLDGIEVIRELRTWSAAPVIVLSGRTGSGDKIGALDAGADDYVTKPFSMEELLARLRAALRRDESGPAGPARCGIGSCLVNLAARSVSRDGQPVRLTPDRVAAAGDPGPPSRPAGRRPPAAGRGVGARPTSTAPTTCGSTWPGCAASWRTTRPGRGTC